jgi:hypothetical protein
MAKKRPAAEDSFTPQVHVRMYCQGLGDCFLLRFQTKKTTFFDVLIDCGIYKASPDAGKLMNLVVDDIIETTKDKAHPNGHLDLLVVTHEHWDHISGFAQALDKFQDMDIDEVWQAWTEDEEEPIAQKLLDRFKKSKAALVQAMRAGLTRAGAAPSTALNDAFQIMAFFGVDKKGDETDAYKKIKKMIASKNPRYRSPGEVMNLGDTGVQVFVLGPPKDPDAIAKDDPGKKDGYEKQKHAFFDHLAATLDDVQASMAEDGSSDPDQPFHQRLAIPVDIARDSEFFQNMYAFEEGHAEFFRSIDNLRDEGLSQLALRLDTHLNNTSLVLAFKLPNGKVLLFPGDAQGGNWKSWADLQAPLQFKDEKTNAHQLLASTVLYKVAHHGSHNATPRTFGLELMTNSELRALVPVDHAIAQQARYGEMPLVAIMEVLTSKTRQAVFRSDDEPDQASKLFRFPKEKEKMLPIRLDPDGEAFDRPMYCETTFELG